MTSEVNLETAIAKATQYFGAATTAVFWDGKTLDTNFYHHQLLAVDIKEFTKNLKKLSALYRENPALFSEDALTNINTKICINLSLFFPANTAEHLDLEQLAARTIKPALAPIIEKLNAKDDAERENALLVGVQTLIAGLRVGRSDQYRALSAGSQRHFLNALHEWGALRHFKTLAALSSDEKFKIYAQKNIAAFCTGKGVNIEDLDDTILIMPQNDLQDPIDAILALPIMSLTPEHIQTLWVVENAASKKSGFDIDSYQAEIRALMHQGNKPLMMQKGCEAAVFTLKMLTDAELAEGLSDQEQKVLLTLRVYDMVGAKKNPELLDANRNLYADKDVTPERLDQFMRLLVQHGLMAQFEMLQEKAFSSNPEHVYIVKPVREAYARWKAENPSAEMGGQENEAEDKDKVKFTIDDPRIKATQKFFDEADLTLILDAIGATATEEEVEAHNKAYATLKNTQFVPAQFVRNSVRLINKMGVTSSLKRYELFKILLGVTVRRSQSKDGVFTNLPNKPANIDLQAWQAVVSVPGTRRELFEAAAKHDLLPELFFLVNAQDSYLKSSEILSHLFEWCNKKDINLIEQLFLYRIPNLSVTAPAADIAPQSEAAPIDTDGVLATLGLSEAGINGFVRDNLREKLTEAITADPDTALHNIFGMLDTDRIDKLRRDIADGKAPDLLKEAFEAWDAQQPPAAQADTPAPDAGDGDPEEPASNMPRIPKDILIERVTQLADWGDGDEMLSTETGAREKTFTPKEAEFRGHKVLNALGDLGVANSHIEKIYLIDDSEMLICLDTPQGGRAQILVKDYHEIFVIRDAQFSRAQLPLHRSPNARRKEDDEGIVYLLDRDDAWKFSLQSDEQLKRNLDLYALTPAGELAPQVGKHRVSWANKGSLIRDFVVASVIVKGDLPKSNVREKITLSELRMVEGATPSKAASAVNSGSPRTLEGCKNFRDIWSREVGAHPELATFLQSDCELNLAFVLKECQRIYDKYGAYPDSDFVIEVLESDNETIALFPPRAVATALKYGSVLQGAGRHLPDALKAVLPEVRNMTDLLIAGGIAQRGESGELEPIPEAA